LINYFLTNSINSIKLFLRRTLVLQQFYSSIVAVACLERSEGFNNPTQHSMITQTLNHRLEFSDLSLPLGGQGVIKTGKNKGESIMSK